VHIRLGKNKTEKAPGAEGQTSSVCLLARFKNTITEPPQRALTPSPSPPERIDTAGLSELLEMNYYSSYVNKLV